MSQAVRTPVGKRLEPHFYVKPKLESRAGKCDHGMGVAGKTVCGLGPNSPIHLKPKAAA